MKGNKEGGQVLVIVALVLVVLLGAMGLAIDMGYLRYMKRQLQTAADAAAIAGALALNSCPGGCAAVATAADAAAGENGFTDGTKGVTVTVNNPPVTAGDPHDADIKYVEVLVSQPQPVRFASIFGVTSATVTARGEAKISSGSNCVYGLSALDVTVGTVSSSCGVVVETAAFSCLGVITAPKIGVVGGSACPGATTIATPQPADPLAYLPTQAPAPPCGTTTASPYTGSPTQVIVMAGSATFNPGVYCGGISITAGAADFSPGTYILTGPGGLNVTAGTVTGTDVTFYNSGTGGISLSISLLLLGSVNLTAPTSGAYEGVLFFQDPSNTTPASFNINVAGSNLTGAYYFPNAPINFLGTVDYGQNAAYTILDAQNISFTASLLFTIKNDYSSLPDGSPIKGGAVLVE